MVILRLFDDRLALLWYRLLIWRGRKTSSYSCFGYTKACDNPVNNAEVPASKQSQPVNCCRRIARTCFLRPLSCHKMRMPGSPNSKPLYQAAKLKQNNCVSFKPNVSRRGCACSSRRPLQRVAWAGYEVVVTVSSSACKFGIEAVVSILARRKSRTHLAFSTQACTSADNRQTRARRTCLQSVDGIISGLGKDLCTNMSCSSPCRRGTMEYQGYHGRRQSRDRVRQRL